MSEAYDSDPIADFKTLVREVYSGVIVDLQSDGYSPPPVVQNAVMEAILALANAGQSDPEKLRLYALTKAKDVLWKTPLTNR